MPVVRIDAAMPLEYISEELIGQMDRLEPFGKANPKPLFAEKEFWIRRISLVGKKRQVIRMRVQNQTGAVMEAIYFGDPEAFSGQVQERFGQQAWDQALEGRRNPICLMLAYYPSVNEYMGQRSLQIVVEHYRCR